MPLTSPSARARWVLAGAALVVAAVAVPSAAGLLDYRGSVGFHAGIEMVGALIGGATAFAFVVRYLAVGDRFELVLGLAFAVNAAADLVHGAIPFATAHLPPEATPELSRFIPATWAAGRLAMAALLVVAAVAVPPGTAPLELRRREALVAGVGSTFATVLLAGALAATTLPPAVRPAWLVPRPLDAVLAGAFVAATALLAREHARSGRGDGMAVWVTAAAATAVVGQVTMSLSDSLYDPRFDVAHAMKIVGYLLPLVAFIAAQVRGLIDQRAITERLRETDRVREQLIRTVTHELRTPLVVITGFSEVLADPGLAPAERADYVDRLRRNAASLHRLVDEVLQFGEGTTRTPATEPLDVSEHVPRVVAQLEPVLRSHHVEVTTEGPAPVLIDGHALERIVTNLLTNAVRYAPDGTTVQVTVERDDDAVRLSVADEGSGVPADERALIFEPFYRGSAVETLRHRGSGIGLAVVRQLADHAGGSVDVQRTPAGGACFVVTFPAG